MICRPTTAMGLLPYFIIINTHIYHTKIKNLYLYVKCEFSLHRVLHCCQVSNKIDDQLEIFDNSTDILSQGNFTTVSNFNFTANAAPVSFFSFEEKNPIKFVCMAGVHKKFSVEPGGDLSVSEVGVGAQVLPAGLGDRGSRLRLRGAVRRAVQAALSDARARVSFFAK